MSCLLPNIERSCADRRMWTQTLLHLYRIPVKVNDQFRIIQASFETEHTSSIYAGHMPCRNICLNSYLTNNDK